MHSCGRWLKAGLGVRVFNNLTPLPQAPRPSCITSPILPSGSCEARRLVDRRRSSLSFVLVVFRQQEKTPLFGIFGDQGLEATSGPTCEIGTSLLVPDSIMYEALPFNTEGSTFKLGALSVPTFLPRGS